MPAESDAAQIARLLRESGFAVGGALDAAHALAQSNEGKRQFDAFHALIHRIEGDTTNAAYWDRRAGTDFGGQSFEAELAQIEGMD